MKNNANKFHLRIRALCEGAIMVALAFVLSFVKLFELPNGGSLTPAMFPILLYSLRRPPALPLLLLRCHHAALLRNLF